MPPCATVQRPAGARARRAAVALCCLGALALAPHAAAGHKAPPATPPDTTGKTPPTTPPGGGLPPPAIAYEPLVACVGTPVSHPPSTLTSAGDPLVGVAPPLPQGLGLGTADGVVSGVAGMPADSRHTVTITDAGGSAAAELSVSITAPPVATQAVIRIEADGGRAIAPTQVAVSGAISWGAELPPGLVFDPATGRISGTAPAQAAAGGPVTLRGRLVASNPCGRVEIPVEIVVREAEPERCAATDRLLYVPTTDVESRAGTVYERRREAQMFSNQWKASFAIIRVEGLQRWIDDELRPARHVCNGTLSGADFDPAVTVAEGPYTPVPPFAAFAVTLPGSQPELGGRLPLSVAQFATNERIISAAEQRLQALSERLRIGIDGRRLPPGRPVGAAKLRSGLRFAALRPDAGTPPGTRPVDVINVPLITPLATVAWLRQQQWRAATVIHGVNVLRTALERGVRGAPLDYSPAEATAGGEVDRLIADLRPRCRRADDVPAPDLCAGVFTPTLAVAPGGRAAAGRYLAQVLERERTLLGWSPKHAGVRDGSIPASAVDPAAVG